MDTFRGSLPFSSFIPCTALKVTEPPSSSPRRIPSRHVIMPSLSCNRVKTCCGFEGGIVYLVYRNDHLGERFFTRGIHNGEPGTKVFEHGAVSDFAYGNGRLGGFLPKQTTGLGGNDTNAVGTCPSIDFELLVEGMPEKTTTCGIYISLVRSVTLEIWRRAWSTPSTTYWSAL